MRLHSRQLRGRLVATTLIFAINQLCAASAFAGSQLLLAGNVLTKCTVDTATSPNAGNLPLTAGGSQRILIATINQDCNGRRGYTIEVLSSNCLDGEPGAKVLDPATGESLSYSVEAINPTNGGSDPDITGLLASSCTGQVARDVTHAKVNSESSAFYVNFSGLSSLAAGTYQDVLTVTLTLK